MGENRYGRGIGINKEKAIYDMAKDKIGKWGGNTKMIGKQYALDILELTQNVIDSQFAQIEKAADVIYASLKRDGLLHVFGCGHSHILMEECFYRAGGLVPINPIFETSTMLHEGAVKSSMIERMSGYAHLILDNYEVKAGEVMLVFSTSGINSLPIEMALAAKSKGLTVVAFTSLNYESQKSRHSSGQKLCDVADIVIDTQAKQGDAMVEYKKLGISAVPGSTVISATVLNALIAEIIERYEEEGLTAPVFVSGNLENGMERNQANIEKYRYRVKAL